MTTTTSCTQPPCEPCRHVYPPSSVVARDYVNQRCQVLPSHHGTVETTWTHPYEGQPCLAHAPKPAPCADPPCQTSVDAFTGEVVGKHPCANHRGPGVPFAEAFERLAHRGPIEGGAEDGVGARLDDLGHPIDSFGRLCGCRCRHKPVCQLCGGGDCTPSRISGGAEGRTSDSSPTFNTGGGAHVSRGASERPAEPGEVSAAQPAADAREAAEAWWESLPDVTADVNAIVDSVAALIEQQRAADARAAAERGDLRERAGRLATALGIPFPSPVKTEAIVAALAAENGGGIEEGMAIGYANGKAEALAVLREAEWAVSVMAWVGKRQWQHPVCVCCRGLKPDGECGYAAPAAHGHAPDCRLAAAIKDVPNE